MQTVLLSQSVVLPPVVVWAPLTLLFCLCMVPLVVVFFRRVRHYEEFIEATILPLTQSDSTNCRKSNLAREEIRALLRQKTDEAIAELYDWTAEKNARRCELIDRELDGIITPSETAELESLQNQMRSYVNRVAPLPLDEVRKLHEELLRKAASAQAQSPP
jgi:hypothetical protein